MRISLPGNQRAGLPRAPANDGHHSGHECRQREGPHPAPKCEPRTPLTPVPEGPTRCVTRCSGGAGAAVGEAACPTPSLLSTRHPPGKIHPGNLWSEFKVFVLNSLKQAQWLLFLSLQPIIHLYLFDTHILNAKCYSRHLEDSSRKKKDLLS